MDILAAFESTRRVLEAEQILMRKRIPFETVPNIQYRKKGCGLGILFDQKFLEECRKALAEAGLEAEFFPLPEGELSAL